MLSAGPARRPGLVATVRTLRPTLDREREPQPERAEESRVVLHIHAVERSGHELAPHDVRRPSAQRVPKPAQPGERAEEERSGSACWIEDPQPGKPAFQRPPSRGVQPRRVARLDQLRGDRGREAERSDQVRGQSRPHQTVHDGRRGEERPARTPPLGGHEPLEDPAQHLGVDPRRLARVETRRVLRRLPRGEPVTLEEVHEHADRDAVREVEPRESAFQHGPLEQPAVQVRQRPERSRLRTPPLRAGVQRAEEERLEDRSVVRRRARRTPPPPEQTAEVGGVAGQVPPALQEVEEHEPAEEEEREPVPFGRRVRRRPDPRRGDPRALGPEVTEELTRDPGPIERPRVTERERDAALARPGGHLGERFHI